MFVLLAARALAGEIVDHTETFDAYLRDGFSGTGGWESSYAADTWSTLLGDGVYSLTDDSSGTWGSGEAMDNHLVYTSETWFDFTLDATIHSTDDDAMGISFRFHDVENHYLLFFTGGGFYPDTGAGTCTNTALSGARLYKVVVGSATLMAVSTTTYTQYATHDVRIVAAGADITVYFDDDGSGAYEADDLLLTATDTTFSDGFVGFYCFNNGEYLGAGCAFDELVVSLPDADDDGYASVGSGGTDCDDTRAAVSPVATEICNGLDDDCDTTIDVGAVDATTAYADADGDGYGNPGVATVGCDPAGVTDASDCDDTDADVFPGADERANDSDDDCDGEVDEDLDTDEPVDTDTDEPVDTDGLDDTGIAAPPAGRYWGGAACGVTGGPVAWLPLLAGGLLAVRRRA
jgi:hypothetical protein